MSSTRVSRSADLMMRHRKAILFLTISLCLAGVYAVTRMPSAVFPQTDFPRVVVLVDNSVMPSDEMMATVTRPIEEAVKGIPGVVVRAQRTQGGRQLIAMAVRDGKIHNVPVKISESRIGHGRTQTHGNDSRPEA